MRRKNIGEEIGEAKSAGFSVYIGPTIPGVITTGKIIRGGRKEALADAEIQIAAARRPGIVDLIVDGGELAESRRKVKTKGEALHKAYRALARNE